MMNNNKILTVSYGTFSCTLEGFDDSFGTMKAIAEYFRDLASDDRYFGAEPPQPDAEMLARIAEREVARRVEAREHEGRIMLKAHDDVPEKAPAAVAHEDTPVAPPAVEEQTTQTPVAAAAAPTAPEVSAPAAQDDAAATPMVPVEEAAETPDPRPAPQVAAAAPGIADDASSFFANSAVDSIDDSYEEDVVEPAIVADTGYVEPDADPEQTSHEAEAEVLAPLDAGPSPVVDGDSIAAKLERIRAVVSRQDTEEAEADEAPSAYTDLDGDRFAAHDPLSENAGSHSDTGLDAEPEATQDEPFAEDDTTATEPLTEASEPEKSLEEHVRAEAAQSIETALETDAESEILPEVGREDAGSDAALNAFLNQIDATATTESDATDQDNIAAEAPVEQETNLAAPMTDAEAEAEEDTNLVTDDISAFDENDEEDTAAPNLFAEDDAAKPEEVVDVAEVVEDVSGPLVLSNPEQASDVSVFAETDKEASAEEETLTPEAAAARLMKVDRAAFEATIEAGALEEFDDEDTDQRETARSPVPSQRADLPGIEDSDSTSDVARLMVEAEQQMAEPEGATRRSAFAHLRAAVAARFADRSISSDNDKAEEETTEAFKTDLAEVVRPRRPVASGARTEREKADARPAPLKLVAEQRVEATEHSDPAPVAPRRVEHAVEEIDPESASGFRAYAQEMGAIELPDLLEAAASYLSFVEGQEEFSRPQLMSRVRQVEGDGFSREDGLRSFGKLLRTGKIEKIRGGRFAAAPGIGFKPGGREAV